MVWCKIKQGIASISVDIVTVVVYCSIHNRYKDFTFNWDPFVLEGWLLIILSACRIVLFPCMMKSGSSPSLIVRLLPVLWLSLNFCGLVAQCGVNVIAVKTLNEDDRQRRVEVFIAILLGFISVILQFSALHDVTKLRTVSSVERHNYSEYLLNSEVDVDPSGQRWLLRLRDKVEASRQVS